MGEGKHKCCACCTPTVCLIATIVIGVVLVSLGAASIPLFEDLYKSSVKTQLVLKKGNEAYNDWHNTPTPVFMQYYIFNYTNVEDILLKKAKPNVTQLGPYSYKEIRINDVIDYNENEITYLQNYSYVFDASTSCKNCFESDAIRAPNTPILTILKKVHDLNITSNSHFFERLAMVFVNLFFEAENLTLFKDLTVKKLIWGYDDPFLKKLKKWEAALKILKINLPKIDSFVALQHNGSKEAESIGNITLLTGKQNVDDIQKITKWRGKNSTYPYWRNKYGNMINGSDGTHFRPFTERTDRLYMFVTDICRSLYLDYDTDEKLFDINLYRYTTTKYLFANHSINHDNIAFCGKEKCYGGGILPIGQCQPSNAPIFMSAPHFYQGDERIINAINGMHPVKKLHATFIEVEPTTGITMEAHKRLQINILAQPTEYITFSQVWHREDNFLPVLFIHEGSKIDQKNADKFKKEVMRPKIIMKGITYGLMALGGVIVLLAVVVMFYKRKKKYEKLENESDSLQDTPIIVDA